MGVVKVKRRVNPFTAQQRQMTALFYNKVYPYSQTGTKQLYTVWHVAATHIIGECVMTAVMTAGNLIN